jgi:predicted membrane protein
MQEYSSQNRTALNIKREYADYYLFSLHGIFILLIFTYFIHPLLSIVVHFFPLARTRFLFYPFSFRLMTTLLATFLTAGLFLYLHTITLKMEAACSSETLVSTHKTAWCNNPQDHSVKNHSLKTSNPQPL